MPTLFRKEYPRRSRAIELLFLILFIVLLIPISSLLVAVLAGKAFEPCVEQYIDMVWPPFRRLHNKINPHKETDMATLTKEDGFTKKQIAEAKILDNNGTYFINGSILPVYINEDGDTYLIEEYEKGEPSEHLIKDLFADGVIVAVNPIGYN
ncbi:DUF4014 family protein [Escherichia coli]|nr:DUF4014 domain-containing protein [Escherichia coli]EFB2350953.1 DUF4014 domain-containing protein [Escherichia coli]EFC3748523.1 DUF4014 domain-containing protein [Escherichia coli]EFF9621318.1 DUF4014 domain-containing protein [Escherichia coli]EFN9952217.1 DUF4014 domain-containing protein [Escherichia coli]